MKKLLVFIIITIMSTGFFGGCDMPENRGTILTVTFSETGFGRKWIEEIAEKFEEENLDVKVELIGDPNITSVIESILDAGRNLSDIYITLDFRWQGVAGLGKLEPLDDLYDSKPDGKDGLTVKEKLLDGFKDFPYFEDVSYVVPWNDTITGIVYNDTMFKNYGLTVPTTTDELENVCEQILVKSNNTVKPFVYAGKVPVYFDFLVSNWWAQYSGIDKYEQFFDFESAEVYNTASGKIGEGRLKALKEFDRFFNINNNYSLSGSASKTHTLAQMDFLNGKAAMMPTGNWLETEMADSIPEGFEMKMMQIPFIEGAKTGTDGKTIKLNYSAAGDLMLIPKESTQKQLGKKFLAFMLKDDMLKLYTEQTGCPRPFKYDIEAVKSKLSKFALSCLDIWSNSTSFYDHSTNPIYIKGLAVKWPAGYPYLQIISNSRKPEQLCIDNYNYAVNNWDRWLADVGIS